MKIKELLLKYYNNEKFMGCDNFIVSLPFFLGEMFVNKLEVGKIVNTHGLRGEVKVVPWTDYPEVFEQIEKVYIKGKSGEEIFNIRNLKYQKNNLIIKFDKINTIDEAEKYKNSVLLADREMLGELEEGVYYIVDLIGCKVISDDGRTIGKIDDVINTGSNDIYKTMRDDGKVILIPVIEQVVKNVDIENKIITVHMLEGLEDL